MLFNYNVGFDRNGEMVPFIEIDYRHLKSEEDWMALRDIIGALKIQIDCNCHVELEPIKETLKKYSQLYPDCNIFKIDIYAESWKVKKTNKANLNDSD
ncbi:MAG: hypothetical protein BGO43_09685 [Gammaproteobacteria bacterium 39-13]|nr:hypothetical protein [Gammaproteobacteria bacterium]OJV93910.1 MAG: hypothetical protein BGO43_09685 [Gammaproteobacteria bacterium 39-13]